MLSTIPLTPSALISFEEFLDYSQNREERYELEDGKLLIMPSESEINRRIAMFLLTHFLKLGLPFPRLTLKTEMAIMSSRATVRVPDLMVLSEPLTAMLKGAARSLISWEMPPPELVVEVVSPGQENAERDYRYKRAQYQARGIQEYWIVDPIQAQVMVLTWVRGLYEEAVFRGDAAIRSGLLTQWGQQEPLTAAQVLQGE